MKNKYCFSGTLNTGTNFEDHNHLTLFETFIEAESEEQAKAIIANNFHLEIYKTCQEREETLIDPRDIANIVCTNYSITKNNPLSKFRK